MSGRLTEELLTDSVVDEEAEWEGGCDNESIEAGCCFVRFTDIRDEDQVCGSPLLFSTASLLLRMKKRTGNGCGPCVRYLLVKSTKTPRSCAKIRPAAMAGNSLAAKRSKCYAEFLAAKPLK